MASILFVGLILLSIVLALLSKKGGSKQSARDFFVGSRQFSAALVFFLSAGEIYSITTMAGLPGGIYAKGPYSGVWFLGYVLLAYPVGYFLGPKIWDAGRRYDAATLPDLFKGYFNNSAIEVIVALTAILFLLPWGQIQFTGLIAALKALGWHFNPVLLISLAAVLAFIYVAIAGIRGSAYTAILKDILMVVAIVMVGVAVMVHSGVSQTFSLPANKFSSSMSAQDLRFSMSTIFLQSLGFYVLPFNIQNLFTAKSGNTIRRSLIGMPLYMLMFPFLILASYYAFNPNLRIASPNDAFFMTASSLLPGWTLGLIAASACLSALVVLAGVCLCISSIATKNLMKKGLPEARQKGYARIGIVVYLLVSMAMTLTTSDLMVTLLNTAYNGITQFFPGVLVVLFRLRVKGLAVVTGLLAGQIMSLTLYLTHHTQVLGFSVGLVSLVVNFAVAGLLTLVFQQRQVPLASSR